MNLVPRSEVAAFCQQLRDKNKKIVFTNGCFDLLHVGHTRYLKAARELGDFLFLGLNSDASVSKLKGPQRPLQTEQERAEILLNLRFVDAVSIFNEETPLELIQLVKPHVLVKGGDWDLNKIVGKDFVESLGGKVQTIPYVPGRSTTGLIKKFDL